MRSKIWLFLAAGWMFFIGIFRGAGGLLLIIRGRDLPTPLPITGSPTHVLLGGIILAMVSIFLSIAALFLWRKMQLPAWTMCRWALITFLAGGMLNGYLLFGNPQMQGQTMNFIAVIVPYLFLHLGKPAMESDQVP